MSLKTRWLSSVCLALGLLVLAAGPAAANTDENGGSYGYVRVVEGSATLMQAGSGSRTPADVNQPVLAGDRIWVPDGSNVELVLADRNLVRLDGGSELLLAHLAASPDANDPTTVLRLLAGNMVVVVTEDSLGDELPRLETPNATIFPQDFGTYRVTTDQGTWTEVTVRRGKAEVEGGRDSEIVQADERAVIEGEDRRASIDVDDAAGFDRLERWSQNLDNDYQADVRYVDDDLRYSAAPLNRYGSWVSVNDETYWRPRVDNDWRPYYHGRWAYTPSGMTWVSSEPWGWVPYHYGSWDFVAGYGWLWQPGYVYSPAWVYWYWGPTYTGWCPIGYYTHYYSRYAGFRFGVYGWAGGDWGLFNNWTFVSGDYFRGYRNGYRNGYWDGRQDGNWRNHWDVGRHAVPRDQFRRGGHLDRGIITTDTRALTPDALGDPRHAVQVLSNDRPRGGRGGRAGATGDGGLPDVTPFIARNKPELPPTVAETVVSNGRETIGRLDGTPLRPSTLGRGDRGNRGGGNPRVGREIPGAGGVEQPTNGRGGRGPQVILGDEPRGSGSNTRGGSPRMGRPIPGGEAGTPSAQGGAPRPDRGGRPQVIDNGRPTADDNRGGSPRMGRPIPGGERGDQGGAPRPDRGERGGSPRPQPIDNGRPSATDDNGGGSPRMGRSIPSGRGEGGNQGGAPRPDRGERGGSAKPQPHDNGRPPASDDNDGGSPRMGRSIPSERSQGGAPRPVIRAIPDGRDREIPPHREGVERPTYHQAAPQPSRSYGDDENGRGARNRGAYERPAYDPPRPTVSRPVPESRVVEPRPEPRPEPERTARPSNEDRGNRGDRGERGGGRQQGGRERSNSSNGNDGGGGGGRGHARRGGAADDGNDG
jgi:hypothetical protein